MSDKIALMISVRNTLLDFSNEATSGVDDMANSLQYALRNAFPNVRMVQEKVKKQRVIDSIVEASEDLNEDGLCLIYFNGHGHHIEGELANDEKYDQALVCYDGLLVDDEIDQLLQKFHPTTRILTLMDCCSSKTVIEWRNQNAVYPKIIHVGAANDGDIALSDSGGGLMSEEIRNLVYEYSYKNYSYRSFLDEIERIMKTKNLPCFVKSNPNVDSTFLNSELFS